MTTRLPRYDWPEGRAFAFTIFDDTDNATTARVAPLYRLLRELGIFITKSVWPLRSERSDPYYADSLQDPPYRDWILQLQDEGFEIGYHGARAGSNPRSVTREALDLFRETLGHDPHTYAHHAPALENLYWGRHRARMALLGRLAGRCSQQSRFFGCDPASEFFWGDLCQQRIQYVRNYGFGASNLLRNDPWTPFHDKSKPFVNKWFSTGTWLRADSITSHLSREAIRGWEREGALVIMGAHLAHDFCHDGRVEEHVSQALRYLAQRPGWFAPVGVILDYISHHRGDHVLDSWESRKLEVRWARDMGWKTIRRLTGLQATR